MRAATSVTYTVDSNGDAPDADTSDGVCAVAGGGCTLRAAIAQANAHAGADTIAFNLGPSGVQTISPAAALPAVTDPVTIDGTTEPGFSDRPLVELSGASIAGVVDGLAITAGASTVRGLIVNRFTGWQVRVSGAGADILVGNYIATLADGSRYAALGSYDGILVDNVPNVQIGGTSGTTPGGACTGDCNLITPAYGTSGHGLGIQIQGSGATGTTIRGNVVGLSRDGVGGFPGGNTGALTAIFINGSSGTVIGGSTTAARNTVGNIAFYGVRAQNAPNTQIQGNFFGTNTAGTAAEGITQGPLYLSDSPNSSVGGPTLVTGQAPGNVLSGSLGYGVYIAGTFGANVNTTVQGNLVGTNATGTAALPNVYGIAVVAVQGVLVGGTTAMTRNVVSGNSFDGVELNSAYNNTVSGNYIGTDITGSAALGNGVGIFLAGSHTAGTFNTIGGTTAGSANVISGSNGTSGPGKGDGIVSNDGSVEDRVLGNLIGTTASGTGALPNAANGIETINGGRMQIGAPNGVGSNTITRNLGAGIRAQRGGPIIFGNSIVANGGLGIANDSPAAGMPTFQVTTVTPVAGGSRIQGTLTGVFAANDYTIQFYANTDCDPSGAGEGEFYLVSGVAHATVAGTLAVDLTSPTAVTAGQAVTGTVTLQNPTQGLLTTSNFTTCKLAGRATSESRSWTRRIPSARARP